MRERPVTSTLTPLAKRIKFAHVLAAKWAKLPVRKKKEVAVVIMQTTTVDINVTKPTKKVRNI